MGLLRTFPRLKLFFWVRVRVPADRLAPLECGRCLDLKSGKRKVVNTDYLYNFIILRWWNPLLWFSWHLAGPKLSRHYLKAIFRPELLSTSRVLLTHRKCCAPWLWIFSFTICFISHACFKWVMRFNLFVYSRSSWSTCKLPCQPFSVLKRNGVQMGRCKKAVVRMYKFCSQNFLFWQPAHFKGGSNFTSCRECRRRDFRKCRWMHCFGCCGKPIWLWTVCKAAIRWELFSELLMHDNTTSVAFTVCSIAVLSCRKPKFKFDGQHGLKQ